ncbi:MAG: hypothetical protein JWM57_46 [Phycisphaerales bacterium]|nr:hypothetical protein [Phycisphaerales bacterium]
MAMRRSFLMLFALASVAVIAPVWADPTTDLLARADQAFAAADYTTAVALYQKLDGQIKDTSQKSAMDERLRFAVKQVNSVAADASAVAPTTAPATQPTARVPHVRPADGQTLDLTLLDLGNFNYDENDDKTIPEDVRKLDGCHIRVTGVMMPLDQSGRVTRFMMFNDLMSCCYGTAPKLQQVALVEMPKDKWMAATSERIAVEGTLTVKVIRDDGFATSIFEIAPTSIKFAAP